MLLRRLALSVGIPWSRPLCCEKSSAAYLQRAALVQRERDMLKVAADRRVQPCILQP